MLIKHEHTVCSAEKFHSSETSNTRLGIQDTAIADQFYNDVNGN